ncbi:MAG: hypothetical protein J6R68_02675 [Clostridia bacterium]|nr:hypothetical protein [Clostridia bacterium]
MQNGYLRARVYTSDSRIPIENAVFTVYTDSGEQQTLLGVRKSDTEGKTDVIVVEAPDSSLSESQGNSLPYATVNARVDHPEYRTFLVNNAQIFAGQISVIEAEMTPVDRNVPTDLRAEIFNVPEQEL